jgi:hypothetical protein
MQPSPLDNITVRIVPRRNSQNHPFTDLFHEWDESGVRHFAHSRTWYVISDSPHARAAEIAAFKKRRMR